MKTTHALRARRFILKPQHAGRTLLACVVVSLSCLALETHAQSGVTSPPAGEAAWQVTTARTLALTYEADVSPHAPDRMRSDSDQRFDLLGADVDIKSRLEAGGSRWEASGTRFDVASVARVQQPGARSSTRTYIPPTARTRFRRYVTNVIGPIALLRAGVTAGVTHARNEPPEWRQGAAGFGRRFASRIGQYAIQETVDYGLSEALRVDDTFERSTKRGFMPRLGDALIQNVTTRRRDGQRIISLPRFASVYAGGVIPAVTWYPERYGVRDGLRAGTVSLGIGFGINVLREFVIRR